MAFSSQRWLSCSVRDNIGLTLGNRPPSSLLCTASKRQCHTGETAALEPCRQHTFASFTPAPPKSPPHFLSVVKRPIGGGVVCKSSSVHMNDAVRPQIEVDGLKAVLLDVDGTLANSDPFHFIVLREFLLELGFQGGTPINEEFYQRHLSGKRTSAMCAELFPAWDPAKVAAFDEEKEGRFRRLVKGSLRPIAGLERLCKWITARSLPCAAVTNAPRANAEQMLAELGLSNFFDLLVIGAECARPKPAPDPYQHALDHFGITATQAFVVEDSPSGLAAAVAAGIPAIGITSGHTASTLYSAGASITIRDFNDAILWRTLEP